ncbi:hypothetical protein [Siccirubricoccus deserti]|uniref:Uncharacterized protein n=1 Tax=Siccirubricoccus deserti TaxID=2013562 RepID=A0A9X0R3Z9_9PROT|nr:hypothetical protein [Siccirubricoccus deserti]MBC4019310.1 hypothetical protein [Siccirubricoccus deserti]
MHALAGGLGGLAGAAFSGDGFRYPPALHVALPPQHFPSADARDRFYTARADETRAYFDPDIRGQRSVCGAGEFGCEQVISAMEAARDGELAQLEALRTAAVID